MLGTYRTIEETHQVVISGTSDGQQMGTQKIVNEYLISPQVVRELQRGECVYKSLNSFGKLILNPYFTDTKDVDLPEQRKLRETSATSTGKTPRGVERETQSEPPPEPPKSVF